MRWSLARMLFLTTTVAILAVIVSQFDRSQDFVGLHVRFGSYLAVLATATSLIANSPPRMKRFCLTYAVFGWGYLLFHLLIGILLFDNFYEWNLYSRKPIMLGILLGFASAFASLVFPGPIDHLPRVNKEVDEKHLVAQSDDA